MGLTSAAPNVGFIQEPDQLEALYDPWRALAIERGNAFLTPEWLRCWLRHYADDYTPMVVAVRDDREALAGLLPLAASRTRRPRTVRFAGSALGDHFEPLCPRDREGDLARAAGVALRSARGPRPSLALENVDADATWWRELSAACGAAPSPIVGRRATLPRIAIEGRSWEEYLAGRSRNLRSQVGRKRRALERDHDIRFRWTEHAAEVHADVGTLFRLHDLRWASRSGDSSLTSRRARDFLADFAAAAFDRGWLRLCVLEGDGAPVAAWLGWRVGDRFAYYQAGFDPAWADRSVGFVLLAETIRRAAEEGAAEYDMLLGTEPFKDRFADSSRSVCTLFIAPRLRPARLLAASEARLRVLAGHLPDRLRTPARQGARAVLARLPLARHR